MSPISLLSCLLILYFKQIAISTSSMLSFIASIKKIILPEKKKKLFFFLFFNKFNLILP
jgi:hypothetical protein